MVFTFIIINIKSNHTNALIHKLTLSKAIKVIFGNLLAFKNSTHLYAASNVWTTTFSNYGNAVEIATSY